ncbi:T9SS type A sorting domain-containing protein [bacterium]|nr:T9SS type A sorting domain-containing protein [bacterium]MBU1984866.1 T9SS type A sorting domain-containing protein [bacterium]
MTPAIRLLFAIAILALPLTLCAQEFATDSHTRLLIHFNEGSGTIAYDASGNNLHGAIYGNPEWTGGRYGTALRYHGGPDGVNFGDSDLLKPPILTCEAWVYADSIPPGERLIVTSAKDYYGYALMLWESGNPAFDCQSSNTRHIAMSPDPLTIHRWYHLAGTFDGSTVRIFVDGICKASVSGSLWPATWPLLVGIDVTGPPYYSDPFYGIIDEVRISDVVRYACTFPDQIRIGDHFCLHLQPLQPTVVYWCCPWEGPPIFSWLPGCEYQMPGCMETCPPYTGPVTWTAQYDSSTADCPLPGGWWSGRFIAQGGGCVCVFFETQLAVELTIFAAVPSSAGIELRWTTASEIENDHFEIHRSIEGGLWSKIGTVPGHGTSSSAHHYSYLDEAVETGTTYSYRLASVDLNGATEWVGNMVSATPTAADVMPATYALHQNHPNPFNPSTEIVFEIPEAGNVALKVFNVAGQKVAALLNGPQNAGLHRATFNGSGLPSGVYFYRLSADGFIATKKMLLLK